MRAVTCPAAARARKVRSTYSRVSTALRPATTWKLSLSNVTPLYVKRIGSSLPGRRPRMRNSSAALLMGAEPAVAHALGEHVQELLRVLPAEAGIGHRDPVVQRLAGHDVL